MTDRPYLAFRFATEVIRPEPVVWGGLTGYQLAALPLAPVFGVLWWMDNERSSPSTQPHPPPASSRA